MSEAFKAIQITDRVYWVGAIDWQLRNFHGYLTSRGSTYNAYLIIGEKTVLLDTVKTSFSQEMMSRIRSVIDPKTIDIVISNHAELDHSGSLPEVIRTCEPERVIASKPGKKALDAHFHWDSPIEVVQDGSTLDIGGATLRFIEARMLHWPDSMFTHFIEDDILFTNDAFGMHLASTERFADELDPGTCYYELAKYYANILLPFSKRVTGQVGKLEKYGLSAPKMIAPDHGPIWRGDTSSVIAHYVRWAKQAPANKAVVIYDTMWDSTGQMARAIADGLKANGAEVKVMPLDGSHRSDIATELLEAGALVVGSPTMNAEVYPTVMDAMTYLRGLKRKSLVGAAFGSYGWNAKAVKDLTAFLKTMDIEVVDEGLKVNYVPNKDALIASHELGARLAMALKERLS